MGRRTDTGPRPWRGAASHRDYTNHAIAAAAPSWRRCLRTFAVWLTEVQCLAWSTVTIRVVSTRCFVQALKGSGGIRTLKRLTVFDIENFFIKEGCTHGPGARRSMQAAIRLFLRFSASRNWVQPGLVDAVPRLRSHRLANVPRGISNDALSALVASPQGSARDRALVLIFATFGVRRGQVCALRLEDIDWRNKNITFRPHKCGKSVTHQLTPAVAALLAQYLQHERPQLDEPIVFLRTRKPYWALGPSAVTAVVRVALRRLHLTCTPCGPHALRHAFATRLLQRGHPPKVIADLLGHRTLDTVAIYAKVNHPQLMAVAADWPEVLP